MQQLQQLRARTCAAKVRTAPARRPTAAAAVVARGARAEAGERGDGRVVGMMCCRLRCSCILLRTAPKSATSGLQQMGVQPVEGDAALKGCQQQPTN
jgi:hypothetical protein